MKSHKQVVGLSQLIIILFSGSTNAKDLAIEINYNTGHMIMPIYRLN